MEKNAISRVMLTMLFINILMLTFNTRPVESEPRTWTVDDDRPADFHKIQEAIDAAKLGDTIYVHNGSYSENLIVDKSSLTLRGENRNTVMIGGSRGDAVSIKADNTKIRGFTIQGGYSGVQISPWSHGHDVSDNIIRYNDFGIRGHYDVHNITISDNVIGSNNFIGIELAFYNSTIKGNVILNNGRGEFLTVSAGIQIVESIYNITVSSNNNRIVENIFKDNFNGIFPVRYSEGNFFSHNTFYNNTNHVLVWDSSLMSKNRVEENYWGNYAGRDDDGDGFGDTPYLMDAQNRDNRPLMSPFYYWSNPLDGDVNKDMKVDMKDITIITRSFGSYPSHPRWNIQADVNEDNKIDIKDVALAAKNFGKTYA